MSDNTVLDTRKILNQFIGQIAIDFGLLKEEERNHTLDVVAVYRAQELATGAITLPLPKDREAFKAKITDLAGISDPAQRTGILTPLGISEEQFEAAKTEIGFAGKGLAGSAAPATGDIAGALGYNLTPHIKSALLTGQAGFRTAEIAKDGVATKQSLEELSDVTNNRMFKFVGDARDPSYLQSAQAANYLANLVSAAEPAIQPFEGSKATIQSAYDALQVLSAAALKDSAREIASANITVTGRIMAVANDVKENVTGDDIKAAYSTLETSLATIKEKGGVNFSSEEVGRMMGYIANNNIQREATVLQEVESPTVPDSASAQHKGQGGAKGI